MRYYLMLALGFCLLITAGCDSPPSTQTTESEPQLTFSGWPSLPETGNKKEPQLQSNPTPPYGCFINVKDDHQSRPWNYWSIVLHYPKDIIREAGNTKLKVKVRIHQPGSTRLSRLANCIIPQTPQAVRLLKKLMLKRTKRPTTTSQKTSLGNNDVLNDCGTNNEGFSCPPGYCWSSSARNDCVNDEGQHSLPEVHVDEEEGPSGGGDPSPNDPYDPPSDGGDDDNDSGNGDSPCTSCAPGDSDGYDDGDGESEEDTDEDKPCKGNVIKNPKIAPSGGWNEWGGQFGYTRSGGNQFHDGTDIKVDINSDLYSMHSGTVVDIRNSFDLGEYRKRSYGNYVRIKSTINGDMIYLRYNHLNQVDVGVGDVVSAGDIIGKSGNTGNAQTRNGVKVIPHVHIRARKVVNGQQKKVDPENYMATKFNNDGTVNVSESNCNE